MNFSLETNWFVSLWDPNEKYIISESEHYQRFTFCFAKEFVPQTGLEYIGKSGCIFLACVSVWLLEKPWGCFTNVSRALQNILSKFMHCRNRTSYEKIKLKLCACAQSHSLGTRSKFQLQILTINVISCIVYFREIILESSRNVSETTPGPLNRVAA